MIHLIARRLGIVVTLALLVLALGVAGAISL